MGAPYTGKDGLIYLSGTELLGANAWEINASPSTNPAPEFGDTWTKKTVSLLDWSGSVTAWDQGDEKVLFTMATAGVSVALLIYPTRDTLTSYYSGNAIFGVDSSGSTSSTVARNGSFEGDGALTATGFS
jgi:hypothetical protein